MARAGKLMQAVDKQAVGAITRDIVTYNGTDMYSTLNTVHLQILFSHLMVAIYMGLLTIPEFLMCIGMNLKMMICAFLVIVKLDFSDLYPMERILLLFLIM